MTRRLPLALAGAALAVLTAGSLVGCAFIDSANQHDETSYRVTEAFTALTVRNDAGRVEVLTGAGAGAVSVREQYTYAKNRPDTTHEVEGGTLNLVSNGCHQTGINRRCQVDYRIQVPTGTSVTVNADAGTVTVTGISAAVKVEADAGTVTLTDVTGAVDVTADAGTINGTGLTGVTTVHSDAGSIDLTYATAPSSVKATSDAGKVTVRLPEGSYAVDATVDAGRRAVEVPTDPASPNKITVRSSAGSVEVIPA